MSKKNNQPTITEVILTPETVAEAPVSSSNPKLLDVDKMALDLAKERRLTALAEAKAAMAKNDNAELAFKYVVLQIYMKYGLDQNDAISESGEIIKGGAAQQTPGQ